MNAAPNSPFSIVWIFLLIAGAKEHKIYETAISFYFYVAIFDYLCAQFLRNVVAFSKNLYNFTSFRYYLKKYETFLQRYNRMVFY